jgi:O-antigen/teichoic acid export membrane protein
MTAMPAAAAPPAAAPSLASRVMRSSAITMGGFAASQALRLLTNLALTRLLFPEAFGLMAMVSVVLMALAMLSDIGTGPAIMGSRRGDDPAFLDTAWTIQIARGALLWLAALLLAAPLARFWGEPDLALYLPVAAVSLLVAGFNPTRLETQNRHLRAGRVTLIELATQGIGTLSAVLLAWATGSVWALVASNVIAAVAMLLLLDAFLPGPRNRLRWEREAASELIRFGQWIFLATLCGFAIGQADKVILGRYLDLAHFGHYNIAYFLASVPLLLGGVVARRALIPVYRDSPPAGSAANRARIRRLRAGALVALLALSGLLALGGEALVRLLYDPRYHAAGALVVLVAATQGPAILILTCDQAALASGDSRRFFAFTLIRALLVTGGLLAGLHWGGLAGAVLGQGLANLAAYPALAWLLRPHGAWDPALDAGALGLSGLVAAGALWLHAGALAAIPP